MVLRDHIGDPDPSTRREHPEHLSEHFRLVDAEVDHTVADDHVDRTGRQRNVLDGALHELDVAGPGLGGVGAGQVQHLLGHVDPIDVAGRTDPLGRQQHVDAAARTQVQHSLASAQLGDGCRVPTAETGRDSGHRQPVTVKLAIERAAEPFVALQRRRTAARRSTVFHRHRGGGIAVPHLLAQGGLGVLGHRSSSMARID
jgi:hypothetical protein